MSSARRSLSGKTPCYSWYTMRGSSSPIPRHRFKRFYFIFQHQSLSDLYQGIIFVVIAGIIKCTGLGRTRSCSSRCACWGTWPFSCAGSCSWMAWTHCRPVTAAQWSCSSIRRACKGWAKHPSQSPNHHTPSLSHQKKSSTGKTSCELLCRARGWKQNQSHGLHTTFRGGNTVLSILASWPFSRFTCQCCQGFSCTCLWAWGWE